MIYIIFTSCLLQRDFELRKEQYTKGLNSAIERYKNNPGVKMIIVEGNGQRKTFLDDFGIPVLYTTNNHKHIVTGNIGTKEILDVFACINYMGIQDDDFVVKFGARYYVDSNCPFFDEMDKNKYDAIATYTDEINCFTGIIGMRCKYVKKILVSEYGNIEMHWANVIKTLENKCILEKVGMYGAPGGHTFRLF